MKHGQRAVLLLLNEADRRLRWRPGFAHPTTRGSFVVEGPGFKLILPPSLTRSAKRCIANGWLVETPFQPNKSTTLVLSPDGRLALQAALLRVPLVDTIASLEDGEVDGEAA